MFVVVLTYKVPLSEVDRHMKAHVKYLEACYAKDIFVASGRQKPRRGGVILARGVDRETLDELLTLDPFHAHGVADFEVIEFRTSLHAQAFADFADPGTRAI